MRRLVQGHVSVTFLPSMDQEQDRHGLATLTLGAVGVVYGDIGTSPLYTVKEVFSPGTGADIPNALRLCTQHGLSFDEFETSYFLSRETVVPTKGPGMAHWRERLFAAMARNSGSVVEFFKLPNNSVIELGSRVQI